MALLKDQIQKIVKDPKNKEQIRVAVNQELRLRFHTEPSLSVSEQQEASNTFLKWVKGILPDDKFDLFLSLYNFPLPTNELTKDIYENLERVTESRNPFYNYSFSNSNLTVDWEIYRTERLKDRFIWKTEGFSRFKNNINSILIVDLPQNDTSTQNPYFYWLNVANVVDFELIKGKINWIVFTVSDGKLAAFDDTYWQLYSIDKEQNITEDIVKPHGLGYCPARLFWTTPLNIDKPFIKESPLSHQLSNLDWVLFWEISKRILDLYAAYPIYSGYPQKCDFEDPVGGTSCSKGFLINSQGNYVIENGQVVRCPICKKRNIGGVGSFVEVPLPSEKNGMADLRNPVQITTIDSESLKYNVDECERLKVAIKNSIVGRGYNQINTQAINEDQVLATFDEKKNVLMRIKANFEEAQKWVNETCARIRYGSMFVSASVNWGDEFFIYTVNDLRTMYQTAKTTGTSDADLDYIYDQIIATEHRNNPIMYKRLLLLRDLEPFRNLSTNEVLTLFDKGIASKEEYLLKADFSNFISRFERENINVLEFGNNLPYYEKVERIKSILLNYVKEKTIQG